MEEVLRVKHEIKLAISVSAVSFELDKKSFKATGTVVYKDWPLCDSEKNNFKISCGFTVNEPSDSELPAIQGMNINCAGNQVSTTASKFDVKYYGCILYKADSNVGVDKKTLDNACKLENNTS